MQSCAWRGEGGGKKSEGLGGCLPVPLVSCKAGNNGKGGGEPIGVSLLACNCKVL